MVGLVWPSGRCSRAPPAPKNVGLAVWLITVVGAYALERAGCRGPLEALPRRALYRERAGKRLNGRAASTS